MARYSSNSMSTVLDAASPTPAHMRLAAWWRSRRHVVVLTGAGCSIASGIPAYRDAQGRWQRKPPVQQRDFVGSHATRQRYWARSLLGWRHFAAALPNAAHHALAQLETAGKVQHLVTQNVDGLHQEAGSRAVTDLHGRLDEVECLRCGGRVARSVLQAELERRNPRWCAHEATRAPDGDADLDGLDFLDFDVPACRRCGGVLKPAVVFFGDAIPAAVTRAALQAVERADGVLVVGSSLMVWSGYRLARAAAERRVPVVAVNLGLTRADALLQFKIEAPCTEVLAAAAATLAS